MAFLQSDIPPSTAPAKALVRAQAVAPKPPAKPGIGLQANRFPGRLIGALVLIGLLYLIGHSATLATESLAIGVLAADLAFLIAVAGWSAVASGPRR